MLDMCEYRLVIGTNNDTGDGEVNVVAPQGLTIHTETVQGGDLVAALDACSPVIRDDIDVWGCEGYSQ